MSAVYWEANLECEFCDATFNSQDDLKLHQRLHSRRKPYKCEECGTSFSYNSTLEWHMKSHSGEMPYKCEECNAQFTQNSMLVWHKRKHRTLETSQSPPIVINVPVANVYHQRMQSIPRMFRVANVLTGCNPHISDLVNQPLSLSHPSCEVLQPDIHMNMCKTIPAEIHTEGSTSSKVPVVNVIPNEHKLDKEKTGIFRCDICCSLFEYSTDLKTHMETKHNMGQNNPFHILAQKQANGQYGNKRKIIVEKPFQCDLCFAGFNTEGHLKNHRQNHVGLVERPYKCQKCGLTFTDKTIFESHERRHQSERPFKCNRCGAAFFRDSHLQKHIKRHTGELI